jgi:mono/diheme cytochrome c family protein
VAAPTATQPAAAAVSFAKDVLPIFEQRCMKCHGGEKTEEGLSLKTHATVMKGSNNGPVIKPGNPNDSELVKQIVSGDMPKRAARLSDAEIKTISDWVKAGAPNN